MAFNEEIAQAITTVMTTNFPRQLTRSLRRLIAFDNLIILAYHKNEQPIVLYKEYFDPIVYRAMDTHYLTNAYQLDPFYHQVLKGHSEGVIRLLDVVPQGFSRSEYYKNYYQQTTLVDELAIFSKVSPETTLTICLGNDRSSQTPLNLKSIQQINHYAPIIAALAGRHWGRVSLSSKNEQSKFLSQKQLQFFLKTKEINLTPRQVEVATYILKGHTSASIALNLNISLETVKVFRRQLYSRCGVSSQAELFALLMPIYQQSI